MARLGTVTFTGASGAKYIFDYYNFSGTWNTVAGVYIIAKYDRNANRITAIYVGETDNLQERLSNHHRQSCFNDHGADTLCWRGETSSQTRLMIESDLIAELKPPCND